MNLINDDCINTECINTECFYCSEFKSKNEDKQIMKPLARLNNLVDNKNLDVELFYSINLLGDTLKLQGMYSNKTFSHISSIFNLDDFDKDIDVRNKHMYMTFRSREIDITLTN